MNNIKDRKPHESSSKYRRAYIRELSQRIRYDISWLLGCVDLKRGVSMSMPLVERMDGLWPYTVEKIQSQLKELIAVVCEELGCADERELFSLLDARAKGKAHEKARAAAQIAISSP